MEKLSGDLWIEKVEDSDVYEYSSPKDAAVASWLSS